MGDCDRAAFEAWLGTEDCPVHVDESANKNAWYGWQAARREKRKRCAERVEKVIELIRPDDFEKGSSEYCALAGAQTEIRGWLSALDKETA